MMGLRRAASAFALVCTTSVACAQQQQGTMTLKVGTQIVVLDVTVVDKNHKPVNNLTKDDFLVLEDKVPQQVRYFEPPSAHQLPDDLKGKIVVNSSADLKKIGPTPITLLVMDETNTAFTDEAYARYCINKYLDAQPAILTQPTTLLVATDTKFNVVEDYTQDRELIREKLKKHLPQLPASLSRGGAGSANAVERMSHTLGALYQIAKASSGLPGRKTIIWIGAGFPNFDVEQMSAASADAMQGAMKRITQTLLESHVTLFTIDPTVNTTSFPDIETPEDLAEAEDQNDGQPYDDQVKFSTLATATGGTALFSRNDVDKEVAESNEQGANYYTLSYRPQHQNETPDTYHKIRIVMKDPNLMAVTRDGYFPRTSDSENPFDVPNATPQDKAAALSMDLTNAAMSDMAFEGLDVTASKVQPDKYKLDIPLKDLSWTDSGSEHQAEITVVVVAFNAKGKPLGHFGTELVARTSADPAQHPDASAAFDVPYALPPNTARVRLVARDAVTGKVGTADLQSK